MFEVTVNSPGAYVGRCAELCGTYHAMMNFEVRAVEPEKFDQFLAAKIEGKSTQEALAMIGEEPLAVTTSPFPTKRTPTTSTRRIRAREGEAGMRTEWRVFSVVAAFLLVISGVYAWWTDYTLKEIDWAGTTALLLSSGLCGMMAGFFWFVARRIELRPEDRGDAEIAEGAGEVGFFSPGSYWPVAIAASATLTAIGVRSGSCG